MNNRYKLLKASLLLAALSSGFVLTAQNRPSGTAGTQPQDPPKDRPGILLLAHGGSRLAWNEEVRHLADRVDLSIPTEVAFGMASKKTMQRAIDELKERGVTRIIAVPLFVSSYSSVITSTNYLLGLQKEAPEDLKLFAHMDHSAHGGHHQMQATDPNFDPTTPIDISLPVCMTDALNHDPIVSDILLDRAASISKHQRKEIVVLVAHGPVPDDENKKWLEDMGLLAAQMQRRSHYAGIEYLTVRDDAEEAVRKAASQELRGRIEEIQKQGKTALVVPLLLSYGGIENGIRKRLDGLSYLMPSQGLLPDSRLADWIIASAQKQEKTTIARHPVN